ncbi:unnamed protein product [Laminaria digitata]
MDSAQESWFANETDGGPSLEDFLATDPSQLPFLQELPEATEDSVRYQLFVDDWDSIEHLQELRESVLRLVDSLTAGFIWHQDPFSLTIAVPPEGDLEPHLQGEQLFGGNVSDEWFVCYLLFAITSSFNGLTACVNDNDGEFLLIEAATAIPPFLSPANSNHRVWIRFSELHLVMPGCMVDRARTPRTLGSGVISLSEGLKAVRESDGWTKADEGVQRLIRCRIEGYPEKATADMHHARCFLPLSAALVFRQSPGLVSAAVRSFCSGDPADKKHGVRMARLFPPPTAVFGTSGARSTDGRPQPATPRVVETRIAFTRYLYAQLHQAAVVPSRAFPPGWGPVGSALSPTPHSKAAHLGQKLSMGLEAAYQASAESCDRSARGDLRSAISPSAWKTFLSVLEQKGFFEGELEGSKRYREKTAMAEQFVRDSVLRVDDSEDKDASAAQRELRRCTVHEVVDRDISDVGGEHVFDSSTEEDDKEDWLEVSQADLDTLLQDYNRSGAALDVAEGRDNNNQDGDSGHDRETNNPSSRQDGVAGANDGDDDGVAAEETKRSRDSQLGFTTAVDELDDIVTGMNAFVDDSEAGLEGAEVEAVGGNVQFDVNKFMSLLNGEDLMSAIDGAAKEDAHGGLYDSEDDLLESSEEEDDDDDGLEQKTQRMPEPRGGGSARPKGTPTPPSGKRSSSLCDTPVRNSGPSDVRSGGKSHIRTKAGVRPTVAFQMQEMEGRPSEDDLNDSSADSGAKKPSVAAGGEGGTGGTTDFMREYMAAMEVELDPSAVGQSFEKVGQTISEAQLEGLQTVGPLDQNGKLAPEEWLRSDSTQPATDAAGDQPAEDIENPAEEYKPVDVDMNLVKHLLESTVSQGGLSGPASNLLRSMGLSFPSIPPGSGAGKSPTKIEDVTPSTGGV